jgi:hypothetical protein
MVLQEVKIHLYLRWTQNNAGTHNSISSVPSLIKIKAEGIFKGEEDLFDGVWLRFQESTCTHKSFERVTVEILKFFTMVSIPDPSYVKVYTVNGAAAGSSSSLPDWLTRKRAAKKGKRAAREQIEGTIELIQGFEFPQASNRIKTTHDGHHAIATGTYKPQIRVWDLDQLTLKFERHSDAENVDFIVREFIY